MRRPTLTIVLTTVLLTGIVSTGISLVTTTHQSRILFRELESLRREQDRLQGDWSALQLEVSTLAGHSRIDTYARRELGMTEPGQRMRFIEVGR